MRNVKDKKFENKNIKNLLKKIGVLATFATMGTSLVSCGQTKTTETESSIVTETKTETSTTELKTELQTEDITEVQTEDIKLEGLDINNNASIEETVDKIYSEDKDFYDQNGISKNDIRNMIFVINDRYYDDNKNLLMDEASMNRAYDSINYVMFSDGLFQKMDNVGTVDYDVDNFELIKQPSLVNYVDMNLSGSYVLVDEIKEYEKLRDHEVEVMNKEGRFDINAVNEHVIKNEVTDINSNSNPLSAVSGNGQIYVMAATHKYALDMAAKMNDNDAIYLRAPEYDEINTVKINLTKGERDVLGVVENLIVNGLVTDEQYDNIVTFVEKEQELGVEKDEIIKTAAADYDLEMDRSNILVSGAMAELSMSVYGWNRTMCSSFNSAKLATINQEKTSSKETTKKLVITL